MSRPKTVFISYSQAHPDLQWVGKLVDGLKSQGLKVWLPELENDAGEPIADKLEEGLRVSDLLLFVISPQNIGSSEFFFELGAALGMGKRVIAVVDKNVPTKDLPPPIRSRHYLLRGEPEEAAREVAAALAAACGF